MATSRGKAQSGPGGAPKSAEPGADEARLPSLPELMRRVFSLGLSGFFLTEEAVRKALGDTVPREWTDFAVDQSERTRKEFIERLTYEMARSFESVDMAAVLRELLEGRTLEIHAEVRLGPDERGESGKLRVGVRERDRGR